MGAAWVLSHLKLKPGLPEGWHALMSRSWLQTQGQQAQLIPAAPHSNSAAVWSNLRSRGRKPLLHPQKQAN